MEYGKWGIEQIKSHYDVIVVGAGPAGIFTRITATKARDFSHRDEVAE
ncbi:hypothetical protein [Parageobacillus galactosidasius]|nr:hypothetical protein [Parageobacillus galactosidasius]